MDVAYCCAKGRKKKGKATKKLFSRTKGRSIMEKTRGRKNRKKNEERKQKNSRGRKKGYKITPGKFI